MLDIIKDKLTLLGMGVSAVVALVVLVVGTVVLWVLGLAVAFVFFVIGIMLLYILHKMDSLDVKENKWLILFAPFMFFIGLGLDKAGILSIQPLSLADSLISPSSVMTLMLVAVIIALLIATVAVSRD